VVEEKNVAKEKPNHFVVIATEGVRKKGKNFLSNFPLLMLFVLTNLLGITFLKYINIL